MRPVLPLIALTLTTAATAAEAPVQDSAPELVIPATEAVIVGESGAAPCRDQIHAVREERGLPRLQRETASPDEPLLIAAVDHRIGGCSVMLIYHDTSDVRPLPAPREGSPLLERIPGD